MSFNLRRFFSEERRVIIVAVTIALAQGLNALTDLSISYLYKDDYKLRPAQVSALHSLLAIPWLLKPCWGMISDNLPLFGYKRKTYLALMGLVGFLGYIGLGVWSTSINSGIFLILLVSLSFAFNNVIGEALLVESAQKFGAIPGKGEGEKQKQASNNVSLFFGFKNLGTILSSYFGGYLLEHTTKWRIIEVASILPLAAGLLSLILPETRRGTVRLPERHIEAFTTDNEIIQLLEEENRQAETTVETKEDSNFKMISDFLSQPEIYKPLAFLFVFLMTPSSGSAMFYFYTNELKFSPEFMGELKLAGSIAVLIGIFLYNRFLVDIPFRKIFLWTTLSCFVLSLAQIVLTTRANIRLGISDKVFCIGDSIIYQVFGELNFLPLLVLACRLCPKNVEGTMYALFMAVFNCGGIASMQLGALLIWMLDITATNFKNLWILALISSTFTILPLLWLNRVEFEKAVKATEEGKISRDLTKGQETVLEENDGFKEDSIRNDTTL